MSKVELLIVNPVELTAQEKEALEEGRVIDARDMLVARGVSEERAESVVIEAFGDMIDAADGAWAAKPRN